MEGRHAARHRNRNRHGHRLLIVLAVTFGLVSMLAGGAAFAGYRYDRGAADRLLPGVTVAGIDLSGMTRPEAETALQPAVQRILGRPITITAGSRTWRRTAGDLGASVDARSALDQAFRSSGAFGWPSRVYHRLLDRPIRVRIGLRVSYDRAPVVAFVQGVAPGLTSAARDASFDVVDGRVQVVHARTGHALALKAATRELAHAVAQGRSSATFPVRTVAPKVTDDTLGMAIVVHVSEHRLFLYRSGKLDRSYPVATGQPIYPTPRGHFEIITKEVNPTWHNPARDTWGKNEPAEIGPGPGDPLGTRAMALNAPGILIHGTYDDSSIGHDASHGCIRMHIPDSEALFLLVDVGTPVIIV